MSAPVRLQLSRRKGFRLQALSRETNGLDAVVVTRRSKFGNRFSVTYEEGFPVVWDHVLNTIIMSCDDDTHPNATVVRLFREQQVDTLPDLSVLRSKNLACTCGPDVPCHADVLLELANAPTQHQGKG